MDKVNKGSRIFDLVAGLVYIAFGILAFFPYVTGHGLTSLSSNTHGEAVGGLNAGYLFGRMPVNIILGIIWIVLGLVTAGLALPSAKSARLGAKILCGAALLMFVVGILPGPVHALWGLLPLYGWTSAFHLVTVCFGFYFAVVEAWEPTTADQTPVIAQEPNRFHIA